MNPTPTIGRIVHYHSPGAEPAAIRPAIVFDVHEDGDPTKTTVDLQVFPTLNVVRAVAYSDDVTTAGKWSWPKKV